MITNKDINPIPINIIRYSHICDKECEYSLNWLKRPDIELLNTITPILCQDRTLSIKETLQLELALLMHSNSNKFISEVQFDDEKVLLRYILHNTSFQPDKIERRLNIMDRLTPHSLFDRIKIEIIDGNIRQPKQNID